MIQSSLKIFENRKKEALPHSSIMKRRINPYPKFNFFSRKKLADLDRASRPASEIADRSRKAMGGDADTGMLLELLQQRRSGASNSSRSVVESRTESRSTSSRPRSSRSDDSRQATKTENGNLTAAAAAAAAAAQERVRACGILLPAQNG